MKKASGELTAEQRIELRELDELADDRVDTTEAPEILDWFEARRGVFYRPVKQQITLRLDSDVVDWFKTHAEGGRGYQTDINRALREHVLRCEGQATEIT